MVKSTWGDFWTIRLFKSFQNMDCMTAKGVVPLHFSENHVNNLAVLYVPFLAVAAQVF